MMEELQTTWKLLARRWEDSEKDWNDPVRDDFHERYWQPLVQEMRKTTREVAHLVQILEEVRRSVK